MVVEEKIRTIGILIKLSSKIVYNPILVQGLILTGIVIIIISGIGFIRKSDVKLSGLTLVTAQLTIGLAYLKDFKTITIRQYIHRFIIDIIIIPVSAYLKFYFEFSLQTGYLHELTSPTLLCKKRVGKQLEMLSNFRLGITKLGTDEEKEVLQKK